MYKKTLIALGVIAAMGIAAPSFAENADDANLDNHQANRELHKDIREAHEDNREDRTTTAHENAKATRQDDRDAAEDARDERHDDRNTNLTGVSVKRDSKGRNCVYYDEDHERHVRHSCK